MPESVFISVLFFKMRHCVVFDKVIDLSIQLSIPKQKHERMNLCRHK